MSKEIERKFLVDISTINVNRNYYINIKQGYLENNVEIKLFEKEIVVFSKDKEFEIFNNQLSYEELLEHFFDQDLKFVFNNKNIFRIRTTKTFNEGIESDKAYLTIKGPTIGISKLEYEFEIDFALANELLLLSDSLIEKTRYIKIFHDHVWEIDFFEGSNKGLVIAEIELEDEEEPFEKPSWLLKEVSFDHRYFNNNLLKNPYKNWKG